MLKKIVQDKGGLHDRVTDIIYLKPFDLSECEQYSRQKGLKMSRREIAECYMVFGGVPYYWSYLDKRYSLIQCRRAVLDLGTGVTKGCRLERTCL